MYCSASFLSIRGGPGEKRPDRSGSKNYAMPGLILSLVSDSIDLTNPHRGFGLHTLHGNSLLIGPNKPRRRIPVVWRKFVGFHNTTFSTKFLRRAMG